MAAAINSSSRSRSDGVARSGPRLLSWLVVATALLLTAAGCSDTAETSVESSAEGPAGTIRSSGELAYREPTDRDDSPEPGSPQFFDEEGSDATGPEPADPDQDPNLDQAGDQTNGSNGTEGIDGDQDEGGLVPFVAAVRPDGIELVYADGALGPITLDATMADIGEALGPLYFVEEEPFIRTGFPGGYSVSRGREVLFWAIEEGGRITTIMTTNPKVGLDTGLRPGLPLIDAIALHGEPSFSIGPELREFVSFEDGTGRNVGLSVLVAIGRFGGPVGVYADGPDLGQETAEYSTDGANIKELWFTARPMLTLTAPRLGG